MNKYLTFFLSLLILYACNTKQENKIKDNATPQAPLAPLKVTVIANLHDSLQPKSVFLDTMPHALTVAIPNKVGGFYNKTDSKGEVTKVNLIPPENISLPVLQNEKGEPRLDAQGKPFILGDGGLSHFTNFSTLNGLALDAVYCSIMDKSGNLWFGTMGGGVSKYDGKSFTNFTTAQGLANNTIWKIIEDKSGNLWFGTMGGGVSKYDGKCFTNFTTAQGLVNDRVMGIVEDKSGNLWFGTMGGGVSKYDGKSFTSFTTAQGLASNSVINIIEDKSGNLWFGTKEAGVSKYDGKSFITFTTAEGMANNTAISIFEDKSQNIWFGTYGGGISKYDGQSFTNFTTVEGLASNNVRCITEDKTGNLWFATYGGGVSKYDGTSFTTFTTTQGLANNIVYSVTEDKTGNLWFGTYGGGVSKYDGKAFTSFTTAQGLANNSVYSIGEDKTGNLWFGTYGNGVSKYDGKSFTSFSTPQGLLNINVMSIFEDKTGNIWFGTYGGGVSKYDGKAFTSFTTTQGLVDNNVLSIFEDKIGNIWFGTKGGGVSKYDGKSFTNFTTRQGLAHNTILNITEDISGNLWFGTDGGGASKYDGKSFTNFTTAQGLVNNFVNRITKDKAGNLWFATGEGLSLLDAETLDKKVGENKQHSISGKIFKNFKMADGLPDNSVTQVLQMPNDKMAVGTNLGITLFNISEDFTKLKEIEIFNNNTGYPVKDVNAGQNCMYLDSKGIIWAGTGSEKTALVRFDYAALHKNIDAPTLVIQAVKVEDENICWYDLQSKGLRNNSKDSASVLLQEFLAYGKTLSAAENDSLLERFGNIQFDSITKFHPLPQNLVLPYHHNQIAFEFAAIETSKPFLVKYQYMLEGYDKGWSPITNKSNATFGNIYEGTYTFKLKAQGANGVWSKPITYTFKVLPPWYRTWWAYLIYVLLFLFALGTFSKWREKTLRAEKEKLEKTVEERTAVVEKQKEELVQQNMLIEKEKKEVEKQRQRSDDLLLNILPEEVAEELKAKGSAEAKQFDQVTVLFTDFKGFTQISEKMTPKELVEEIHTCFKAFDTIIEKYGIEKIKTIGDSYMCAGGLPIANTTHAEDVVNAGLEIQQFIVNRAAQRVSSGKEPFQIRIGIHTGAVVAGIVGIKKFAYDIWGDTVNTASRMESSGEVGKVNISGTTYKAVKDKFQCTHRGKIQAKNKGELDMYYVEGSV